MRPSYLPVVLVVLGLPAAAVAQSAPASAPASQPLDARITGQITPGSGLTADEAARRAKATSFDVVAEKEQVAAAQAAVDQAKTGYIPRVSATARYTRLSEIDSASLGNLVVAAEPGPVTSTTPLQAFPLSFEQLNNSYELSASLTIPVSDYFLRVPQSVGAARDAKRATELNAGATTRDVDIDARVAYYDWVRARLSVTVAEQSLEQARAQLGDVKKAFEVGSASKADVLRVESSVAQAELRVVRATNAAELTETRLRTIMHDTTGAPLAIGEDVLSDLPEGLAPYEELVARALGQREELRAIEANERSLEGQAKVTRAAYVPRIDLFANASYANPNSRVFPQEDKWSSTWNAGAQATWTISDVFGASASIRQTQARAAALRAQRAAAADGVRLEVLSAWQGVKEARASVSTTAKTLVTAEEAYRVRRALFQNGRATSLELTDAELDLTRARLDAINARVDLRVATARLERAVAGAR